MSAGQMDVAYCGWTTTLSAVQKGVPLFIAAENHIGGSEYLALVSGDLDGYICCDPWGSMAEYSGAGHILVRQDTDRESGHGTCCKVAMNYNFAKAHPELAQRILLAHTICL